MKNEQVMLVAGVALVIIGVFSLVFFGQETSVGKAVETTSLPAPSDLLAFYSFEEGAKNDQGNTVLGGTFQNGAITQDDSGEKVLFLEGVESLLSTTPSNYMSIPSYSVGTDGTLSLWFKHNITGLLNPKAYLFHGYLGGRLTRVYYDQYGRVHSYISQGDSFKSNYFDNLNVLDGEWHSVVLISQPGNVVLLVDGQPAISSPSFTEVQSSGESLIGAFGPTINTPYNFMPGFIDDVALYNKALTESEITALRAATGPGKVTSGDDSADPYVVYRDSTTGKIEFNGVRGAITDFYIGTISDITVLRGVITAWYRGE